MFKTKRLLRQTQTFITQLNMANPTLLNGSTDAHVEQGDQSPPQTPPESPPLSPSVSYQSTESSSQSCHSLSEGEDDDYDSQSPPMSPTTESTKALNEHAKLLTKPSLRRRLPSRRKPATPRYKLLHEGDIQLCRLNHRRTLISKIMNSRYLRRWESHHLLLGEGIISSGTVRIYLINIMLD